MLLTVRNNTCPFLLHFCSALRTSILNVLRELINTYWISIRYQKELSIVLCTKLAGLAASLIATSGSSASPAACIVFPPWVFWASWLISIKYWVEIRKNKYHKHTKLALLAVAIVMAWRIPAKTVRFIFAEKKKKREKNVKNRS